MSVQLSHEDRVALSITNIVISRMDGIREGYRVDSLSPGMNLIHGPNGIGKSRTAQAFQALIWPGPNADRASIIGNLIVAKDQWNVELEAGKTAYQKNNVSVPGYSFAVPPDSHRDRYLLTLQDLLRVDNRDFALHIQREASGGYDLEQIRSAMKIPPASKRYRPAQSDKQLIEIQKTIRDLRQQEEQLRGQEASLHQLRVQHQNAVAAEKRLVELEAAKSYRSACDDLESARLALNLFPRPVSKMFGDEFERAENVIQSLAETRESLRTSSTQVTNLEGVIRETGLPTEIPSTSVVEELNQRVEEVRRYEREIEQANTAKIRHTDKIAQIRNRLMRDLTEEQMERLDETGFRDLAELSRKWQEANNRLHVQNELDSWLGTATENNRESLKGGIELLSRYLRTQSTTITSTRRKMVVIFLIAAAIIIILAAVLLATSLSQYSLLLALAALPLLWLGFTMNSDLTQAETRQIQSQYLTLGLEEPAAWVPDEVFRVLRNTQEMAAKADLEHERALRWANLEHDRQQAARDLQALENERASYTASYGILLTQDSPQSLTALADALGEWRQERILLTGFESEKTALEICQRSTLGTIQEKLHSSGMNVEIHDGTDTQAAIRELQRRITSAAQASSELRHTRRRIDEELVPKIRDYEDQLSAIFNALDLEPNDLAGLKNLCDQVKPYQAARNAVNAADITVTTLHSKLRQGVGDDNLDRDAIENLVASHLGLAGDRDTLQAEISRTETKIAGARNQTRLETELAKEKAALEVLSDGRMQDYSSAADRLVFELVRNRNREINRPSVFRSADNLFVSFTNGAYRLSLDEGNSEFTAVEADTNRSVTLDKLSSGTRVQLLLAIRLAFIEASEKGLQLPLIMDETLGNTDDARARAIIEATIEIAARGRQVVYFTAQSDEISKWSAALGSLNTPLDWEVFDLASIRNKASAKPISAHTWDPSTFATLEVSEDADRNSILDQLGVASFDTRTALVAEVDLWYLVPDVSTLVTLRNRGVKSWGQYLNLHGSRNLQGVWSESLHEKATARALVIEAFCVAWREGRPEPLTVNDLNSSRLITARYWDEVVNCAQRSNWEATALIRALENGTISGFRRTVTESLSDWLSNNGFITDAKPLDDATIRARVLSSLNEAIAKGIIFVHEIDELLLDIVGQRVPKSVHS